MSDAITARQSEVDTENPWPGLEPYTELSHDFFHGRDAELIELQQRVRADRLTVLFGQSGLGKTSLLQAGLFPHLRTLDFLPVYCRLEFDEDAQPLEQIKFLFAKDAAEHRIEIRPFAPGESLWGYFQDRDTELWNQWNRLVTPVLVLDQFEEIFTRGRNCLALSALCDELSALAENRAPETVQHEIELDYTRASRYEFGSANYKIVLSLREEFLPELEGLQRVMPSVMLNRMRLNPMNGIEAREAIVASGGHLIADGIAERIVDFVAASRVTTSPEGGRPDPATQEVQPALLNIVCRELNNERKRRHLPSITAELLSAAQSEIVTTFYTSGLVGLSPDVKVFIEDRLLTSDGYRDSCSLADALNYRGVTREAIQLLEDRRLLRVEERRGTQWVELTHDLLTEVIRQQRELRRQQTRELQEAEERAQEERQRTEQAQAEARRQEQLAQEAAAREQAARQSEQRIRKSLHTSRIALATSVVLLVVAVSAWVYGLYEQSRAVRSETAARNQREDAAEVSRIARHLLSNQTQTSSAYADELLDWASPAWNVYLHDQRALLYGRSGDFPSERKELDRALRIDSTRADLLVSSSNNFLSMGDADGAVRDAKKALASGASDASAYANLIIGEAMQGNYRDAIADIDKAIDIINRNGDTSESIIAPDLRDFVKDFRIRDRDSDFGLALHYLKAILMAMNGDPEFSKTLQHADDTDRDRFFSRTAYTLALNWEWLIVRGQAKRDASNDNPLNSEAVIRDYGAYAGQAALWARIAATRPDFRDRVERALTHFRTAHERAQKSAPDRAKLYAPIADWVEIEGKRPIKTTEEPSSPLGTALDLQEKATELRNGTGDEAYQLAPAVALLSKAISLLDSQRLGRPLGRREEDTLIDLLLLRSSWKLQADDKGGAVFDARRVIAIDPGVADAHRILGDALTDDDPDKKAEYERAIARDPANTSALDGLSSLWERAGDWQKAAELLRKQKPFKMFWAPSYRRLAHLEDKMGDFSSAHADIERAIELAPGYLSYLADRRDIEIDNKTDATEAERHYVEGLLELARFEARTGSDDSSATAFRAFVEAFHRAAALDPDAATTRIMDNLTSDFSSFLEHRFSRSEAQQWWQSITQNPLATEREKQIAAAEVRRITVH